MICESRLEVVGDFPDFPPEVIRAERSQPRVSVAEALGGGPIHRRFVEELPAEWRDDPHLEVFSRVLWLKEGWYPLTPHYHFDWGQGGRGPRVETRMVLLGGASRTEFVLGPLEHPPTSEPGAPRRRAWDAVVEAGLAAGRLRTQRLEPQQVVLFDDRTLHRARPATRAGWRVLIRAIRGLERREGLGAGRRYGDREVRPGALAQERRSSWRPRRRAPFTTCRNGFVPLTEAERARYAPYQDEPRRNR